MSFLHLYKFAEELAANRGGRPFLVGVSDIRQAILDRDYAVGVDVFPVELDAKVSLGHVIIRDTKEDRYDEEGGLHASVRFDRELNTCWARFVCCKEMMHLFDDEAERTDSREKFEKLLREIEASPLEGSAALESEYKAEWMALLILCPKPERDRYKAMFEENAIGPYDIALHFRIPVRFVGRLLSEFYDNAYDRLILAEQEPEAEDPNELPPLKVPA